MHKHWAKIQLIATERCRTRTSGIEPWAQDHFPDKKKTKQKKLIMERLTLLSLQKVDVEEKKGV